MMDKATANLIQSSLWHAIAAVWALIAIARWFAGEDGTDAMVQFGIALILGEIFELRHEVREVKKDHHNIKIVCYNSSIRKGEDMANSECMARDCVHCLGRLGDGRLGCVWPENDRPSIGPDNCGSYMSTVNYECAMEGGSEEYDWDD